MTAIPTDGNNAVSAIPRLRAAILDDYLGCAFDFADWSRLADRLDVVRFTDPIPPDELPERLAGFDILCLMRDRTALPREVIAALPRLKFISFTGPSNLALDEDVGKAGITVSNTESPGGLAEHFEFIWTLLLATVRGICANDTGMRAGGWQTTFGRTLRGSTLGILGLGNFGSMVARMARQFDMDVVAWSHNLTSAAAEACGARFVPLDELLRQSDVVTIHLRLSDRTVGLIGHDEFAKMKPGAMLINTSRGPIVDETALIEALRGGRLARAGLDVFDVEPLPKSHPLRGLPNVVLSPHMGFSTQTLLRSYHRQTLENVTAWLDGKPIRVVGADAIAGRTRN